MTTEYIYGLIDPTNSMISYIGRTYDPLTRWDGHINDDGETIKAQWIRRLKSVGITPILVVLEKVEGDRSSAEVEQLWVDMGLRMGWPLMNSILLNGSKYKKREIDRFSESIADWMITNHLEKITDMLERKLNPSKSIPLPRAEQIDTVAPNEERIVSEPPEIVEQHEDLSNYLEGIALDFDDGSGNMRRGFINAAVTMLNGGKLPTGTTFTRLKRQADDYISLRNMVYFKEVD